MNSIDRRTALLLALSAPFAAGTARAQAPIPQSEATDITLPDYVRFDAEPAYSFRLAGARMIAQLNLKNLFNKRYYISDHQFSPDWIQPGPPRTLTASIRVEL